MRLALFAPRYWPTWCLMGPSVLLGQLPWRVQYALGRALGRLGRHFAHRRRRIAEANIALCLPALSDTERKRLLIEHFESLGIGLLEVATCWWMSSRRLRRRVHIEGLEHLRAAAAQGHGVVLLTAHFTSLELGGRLIGFFHPVMAVYRPHENPLINEFMRRRRTARSAGILRRGDLRAMLRALRNGNAIWYAPDQAYLGPRSVQAPFFGVPAPTNTATSRIAQTSRAPVLPFFVRRLPGAGGYRLDIGPALQDFPGTDALADATRVNAILEEGIRRAPAQYLWSHDRFKRFRRP